MSCVCERSVVSSIIVILNFWPFKEETLCLVILWIFSRNCKEWWTCKNHCTLPHQSVTEEEGWIRVSSTCRICTFTNYKYLCVLDLKMHVIINQWKCSATYNAWNKWPFSHLSWPTSSLFIYFSVKARHQNWLIFFFLSMFKFYF